MQKLKILQLSVLALTLLGTSFSAANAAAGGNDAAAAAAAGQSSSTSKNPGGNYPIVAIPGQCVAACEILKHGLLTSDCVFCLNSNGAVNNYTVPGNLKCDGGNPAEYAWVCMRELTGRGKSVAAAAAAPSTTTPKPQYTSPVLQRLPLYEFGFTSAPAIPVLYPARFMPETGSLYKETRNMAYYQFSINFQYGQKGYRIGNYSQALNVGSELDPATACVQKQCWLMPRGAASQPCAGSPAIDAAFANITLEAPEQLAVMFPTNRQRATWQPTAQAEARLLLTDLQTAQDSVWTIAQNIFTSSLFFKNITSAKDLTRVKQLYPKTWKSEWTAAFAQGRLVELDFMYLNGWNPAGGENAGRGTWNIACHALMVQIGSPETGDVKLRVVAVVLANAGGSTETAVYTAQRSESAFILALACVRSAFTQHLIWFGHVFHYHIVNGALLYSVYNSFEPGVPAGLANHPVRQLLDYYLDPTFNGQFLDFLFLPGTFVPPTPVNVTYLPKFFEIYSKSGPFSPVSLYSTTPAAQLAWSGLNPRVFTEPGAATWSLYSMSELHLKMAALCQELAANSLSAYYKTDKQVELDAQIQRWAAALISTQGANLKNFDAAGSSKVRTRAALYDLVGTVLYVTVAHGTAHLQDYFIRMLSIAHHPIVMSISSLPSPRQNYTLQELVAAMPNMDLYGKYAAFCFSFIGAPGFTQMVPGELNQETGEALPNITAELPFVPSRKFTPKAAAAANAAVVKFRRDLSAFLADTSQSDAIRIMKTYWGSPLAMPRIINL